LYDPLAAIYAVLSALKMAPFNIWVNYLLKSFSYFYLKLEAISKPIFAPVTY